MVPESISKHYLENKILCGVEVEHMTMTSISHLASIVGHKLNVLHPNKHIRNNGSTKHCLTIYSKQLLVAETAQKKPGVLPQKRQTKQRDVHKYARNRYYKIT